MSIASWVTATMRYTKIIAVSVGALFAGAGWVAMRAQDPVGQDQLAIDKPDLPVSDPSCTFFGAQRDKFVPKDQFKNAAAMTDQVIAAIEAAGATLPSVPGGSRTDALQHPTGNTIDKYIFAALAQANVAPAPA